MTSGCADHGEARHRRSAWVSYVALAFVVAGCATVNPTIEPSKNPGAIVRPLPAAEFPNACRGIGIDAELTGGPLDPRVAWLRFSSGREVPLVWPPGWEARFGAKLEIVNSEGKTVFKGGDTISGVCLKGSREDPSSVMMIESLR